MRGGYILSGWLWSLLIVSLLRECCVSVAGGGTATTDCILSYLFHLGIEVYNQIDSWVIIYLLFGNAVIISLKSS